MPSSSKKRRIVYLKKSTNPAKKWMVYVTPPGKTVHFGARGMSDYTKHKNSARMRRYSNRHKRKEKWSSGGITTAGFWAKNLLWNKPTIGGSKRDISKRFGVTFRSGWPSKKNKNSKRRSSKRRSKRRSSKRRSKRRSRKRKSRRRKSRKRRSRRRSKKRRSRKRRSSKRRSRKRKSRRRR